MACIRGERPVFSGVSFRLERGGALALVGPNGAGKSSLLRILAGLLKRADGTLEWDGTPIDEPVAVPEQGEYFMLPFGGTRERGGHKGYGIAVIVDIMSGILSGNRAGFFANDRYSQFVMAFNIDAFMDVDQFKQDMDEWMETLANTPPAPGRDRVYYAGLWEAEEEERRRANGIPYHREVINWFNSISGELDLGFQLP